MKFSDYTHKLSHIGIPTEDLKKSVDFYRSLDFEIVWEDPGVVVFMGLSGVLVELYPTEKAAMVDGAVDHFSLDTTDIYATYELAKERGLTFTTDGIVDLAQFENGVKYFKVLGPSNEQVEFSQQL